MHVPLRRTEICQLMVQGLDYIYTLQGWLKGVNSTSFSSQRDPGKDAYESGDNQYVCGDEYGFSLRYFVGDFTPINLSLSSANYFDLKQSGSFSDASPQLYNGNISNMVTGIRVLEEPTLGRAFKYDQLNRLKEALSFTEPDYEENEWGSSQASDSSWYESFSYDANGNITKLKRKGNNSGQYVMDNLNYYYRNHTNKLIYVNDDVSSSSYANDIDDQDTGNYVYDYIGNLTKDINEGIDTIEWTVYGKIRSITRTTIALENDKASLSFTYTPDGHRSSKGVIKDGVENTYSYYVRDAQGNVMAVYELYNSNGGLDTNQLSISNINSDLIAVNSIQTFAEFAVGPLNVDGISGLADAYNTEIVNQDKIEELLLGFDPVSYLLYNTSIQNDVLDNYSTTTLLQSLSAYSGFSSFYSTLMPNVCSDAQILSLLIGYMGLSNFLTEWENQTGAIYLMGNDYANWLVTNSYAIPPPFNCSNLFDVQTLIASQSTSTFYTYLAQATTFYTEIQNVIVTMSQSDIIQQLAGGINTRSITLSTFSTSDVFSALAQNGLATLWGYILDEVDPDSDIVDYYQSLDEEEFVKQCIIAIPTFIDSYLGSYSVTYYLSLIEGYYSTPQYNALIAMLTSKYYYHTQTLQVAEWHMYGSSRVGIYKANKPLAVIEVNESITEIEYETRVKHRYNGKKQYELTNHLGNVLVTISDRRTAICEGGGTTSFESVTITANDYYSYGSPLIGRTYSSDTLKKYRFGFNGQEKENDISGQEGGHLVFEYRIHDARLGRFLSIDPIAAQYPWNSPYAFAENRCIDGIDLEGMEWNLYLPNLFRYIPRLSPIDIVIPVPPTLPAPIVLPKQNGETLTIPKDATYYPDGENRIIFPETDIEWRTSPAKYEGGTLDKPIGDEKPWTGGYRTPKSKTDKKNQKSKDDIPEWAKGHRPRIGEKGTQYAERLLKRAGKYDPKKTGPGSDYNRLKKHADHDFYKTFIMPKNKVKELYNKFKDYIQEINEYHEKKRKTELS
ncbi:MAG: hypothetical protein H6605_08115 [Flavobacteriales bacterium]|nr:hypothetical protein [Flavobacteriales bacterium]